MTKDKPKPISRLTLLHIVHGRYVDHRGITKNAKGLYRCICGNEKEIVVGSVKSGAVVSCGCYHKEILKQVGYNNKTHGLSRHPLNHIYTNIKDRCYNKNCHAYKHYGGRGVVMCDEWLNDFLAFYNWAIENKWQPGLDIDKDEKYSRLGLKSLMYSPETCSVITKRENAMHKRQSVYIEYKGEIKTITEWSRAYGIKVATLWRRIVVSKQPIEKALTNPVNKNKQNNMLKRILPLGDNLLVLPLPKETHSTEAGIQITDTTIAKGKVIEVSDELKEIYKKGDIVLYAENAGISQYYKQQNCLWLNGTGFPKGHIIAVIEEDSK